MSKKQAPYQTQYNPIPDKMHEIQRRNFAKRTRNFFAPALVPVIMIVVVLIIAASRFF